jgi:hypothetical protein
VTLTAWWALDSMEITDPAEAQEALEEAWSRYYPHGGRGIVIRFGDTDAGEKAARLRVDIDINEGRAALHWLPDGTYAIEPDVPAHPRPLVVGDSPYEPAVTVPGGCARVTPGAALRAVVQFAETGHQPAGLIWAPERRAT